MSAVAIDKSVSAFRMERDGDLAVIWFDLPGEKVNKFSTAAMTEFASIVDRLETDRELKRIVIASGKPSIFIAGADVTEFTKATTEAQASEYTRFGQQTLHRFSRLPQITVAAIHGACLGGGTELALSCDYRIMSDGPRSTIGLPEVKLGIFPAWGGTTKLPRLIGLPAALDIILNGRSLDPRRARKAGLVDEVVAPSILIETAKAYARKMDRKRSGRGRTRVWIEGNPIARRIIFSKARKSVLAQTHGHYPAPLAAIDVMAIGMAEGVDRGLVAEVARASRLIMGDVAQNLVRVFFMMEESKKDRTGATARDVQEVGVLGAGIMGGGIAQIVADRSEAQVRMRDINWNALAGGLKAAARVWKKKVDRRRMTRGEMARKLARITTTTDWSGFAATDLVIEAVVENLAIKKQVLADFEGMARPNAIFATNTSTIPITQIASGANRPDQVVGMHFFNPVDRMPLVEVIRGERTSDLSMATVAAFARKLGKTVVICNDGPGFVVNRILGPYINEAGYLLEEGSSIESIDRAMLDFGMPMGPLALLDEVGIDVAAKAAGILREAFPGRMIPSTAVTKLLGDGRLGRKNGKGMYVWREGKRQGPDQTAYALLGGKTPHPGVGAVMVERMVYAMVNEAAIILDEKIVASASELDLAMIMGTGFPPFRGGLLRYADSIGIARIAETMSGLEKTLGPRFAPSEALRRLAQNGTTFYAAYPSRA
jgi:3-hydroxyacyl-CoA dehydrogenase/enoyl-CoA hydratase/3-hydroxybutyryl-CoA epimerase